jgi:hypothetical protein
MSPDNISEWMQPIRQIRVLFRDSTNPENSWYIYVFAIRTLGDQMEYLTIDGIFIYANSKSIMFAEVLVESQWQRLGQ